SSLTMRLALPEALDRGAGKICAGVMGAIAAAAFLTVIMVAGVVAMSFMLSVAVAVTEWLPSATLVLSQLAMYGDADAVPTMVPSTKKSTRMTVSPDMAAALAVAVSATVPLTVAPAAGAVRATVGFGQAPP